MLIISYQGILFNFFKTQMACPANVISLKGFNNTQLGQTASISNLCGNKVDRNLASRRRWSYSWPMARTSHFRRGAASSMQRIHEHLPRMMGQVEQWHRWHHQRQHSHPSPIAYRTPPAAPGHRTWHTWTGNWVKESGSGKKLPFCCSLIWKNCQASKYS